MRDAKDYKNTIEFASEKVHNAWMQEKLSQGYHSPTECSSTKRLSEDLRQFARFSKQCYKCELNLYPYSELSDLTKQIIRDQIITVLNAINYFEDKTCSDCGYFDPTDDICFGGDREHQEQADNPICETFAPKELVEVTTP